MAATMVDKNVILLNATAEKTSDIFPHGTKVSSIILVAGATPTASKITADGTVIYDATPSAASTVDITTGGAHAWFNDVVATLIGTNVSCHVHVL